MTDDSFTLALAQTDPVVGDIEHNTALVRKARRECGADLAVFSELVLSGYPPEDLVLRSAFLDAIEAAAAELAAETADGGPGMIVGAPWRDGGALRNAALLLDGGAIKAARFKQKLPDYGVFDESRVFAAAPPAGPVSFRGFRLGLLLCEDMWSPDPAETLAESGAELLVVLNGSPWEQGKEDARTALAAARAAETGLPLAYVNQVGGQDELVFDGASFALDAERRLKVMAPSWRPAAPSSRWTRGAGGLVCADGEIALRPEGAAQTYSALCAGLRGYVEKNRFPGVIVGLSGGIDSALTAAVAADALSPARVRCVRMPSRYSSDHSLSDAAECAALLGVRCDTAPIEPAHAALEAMTAPLFEGAAPDETEENIQARIRGAVLMALSNKTGWMLLTTGNKSEMSVGYATLYGDMCGGYSVLKDVYKTDAFALARWRNGARPEGARGPEGRVIPESILGKPPSAELRPGQKDSDSLPPYDALDDILANLVERESSVAEIAARGHDEATVRRVRRLLYAAEYKRRQAPPGVKITRRAFGRDRRYPIVNGFVRAE